MVGSRLSLEGGKTNLELVFTAQSKALPVNGTGPHFPDPGPYSFGLARPATQPVRPRGRRFTVWDAGPVHSLFEKPNGPEVAACSASPDINPPPPIFLSSIAADSTPSPSPVTKPRGADFSTIPQGVHIAPPGRPTTAFDLRRYDQLLPDQSSLLFRPPTLRLSKSQRGLKPTLGT